MDGYKFGNDSNDVASTIHTGGHDVSGDMSSGGDTIQTDNSRTEMYVVMGILSFLSVIGTAGNALVLYVFAKKRDRLTSTLFILSLAFVDFITCLIVIPYTIYMEYVNFHIKFDLSCKIYQFLITSNIPFSALIMVAIAIDRYFCICHPFLHAINMFRAKVVVTFLGLIAITLGVIVALMYGVYEIIPAPIPAGNNFPPANVTPYNATSGSPLSSHNSGTAGRNGMDTGTYTVDQARELVFPKNSTLNITNEPLSVIIVYTGQCQTNTFILGENFQWHYQKVYSSLFLICLLIVVILYILIYNSVLARRTRRQKQKSKMLPLMSTTTAENNGNGHVEETLLTTVNGDGPEDGHGSGEGVKTGSAITRKGSKNVSGGPTASAKHKEKNRRKSAKKDRNRVANLKTAAMLFVVTVVFIVTFLPSFMMALQCLKYNMIVFYMYFANNVANPVIYSFMNKNFRDDLRKLFCGRY